MMNIQLLYPAMLVALTGLLVPLLIHLWNRRKGRVVLFGSTQFLEATQRKKVSRISFTQPLLFLLRALMIGVCVLLLIEPVRVSISQILPKKNPNWLLVSPSLLERNDWQDVIDTVRYRECERRVLARGFALTRPQPLKGSLPAFQAVSVDSPLGAGGVWSLLAGASVHPQAPDSIAIYFTPELNDFNGVPPSLPTHITWHEIPPKNDTHHILRAWQESDSKLALIIGKSDEEQTTFKRYIFRKKALIQSDELPNIIYAENDELIYFRNKKNATVQVENKPKLNVIIFYDNSFKRDRNYLIAALKSISEFTDIQIDIKKERIISKAAGLNPQLLRLADSDAVFWLSEKHLDDSIILSSKFQIFAYRKNEIYREDVVETRVQPLAPPESSTGQASKGGDGIDFPSKTGESRVNLSPFGGGAGGGKKVHITTRRLTDAETTTKLPQKLLEILLTPNDFDAQLAQFDQRKIVPSQYNVSQITDSQPKEKLTEEKKEITGFHNMLWWLLLGLFFVERMVVRNTDILVRAT